MIDRERVRKLKENRSEERAEFARRSGTLPWGDAEVMQRVGERPWLEPIAHLMRMRTAPTLEEFERLADGFPAAFRRLRSIVITNRQPPDRHRGWHLRDKALEHALNQLNSAMMEEPRWDWSGNPGAFGRLTAMEEKIGALLLKLEFGPK